ncbi:MAG TPA: Mur ligase domain-containing protein [Candidatus Saccharimonadales bacterium]
MHIYFSGIGGVGLGPLAEIALDAGYQVSGSDTQDGPMTELLKKRGVAIAIGQDGSHIKDLHASHPIDWFVHTAALKSDHPELTFAHRAEIRISKRDELLAQIITDKNLQLIAIAGTHGKTTSTGMVVWLLKQLGIPVSYSIGTTVSFGPSGSFDPSSRYFVYECDEFDRNFLNFYPTVSLVTAIDYDHPDTYPTQQEYLAAFAQFVGQSQKTIMWEKDAQSLPQPLAAPVTVLSDTESNRVQLPGQHNRQNAWLAVTAVAELTGKDSLELAQRMQNFPGTHRRFEKLAPNLYSDYGHHPVEIAATLQMARELSDHVVLVYQPHQNIRQHEIKTQYADCMREAEMIYWLPTYLSRENPSLPILSPQELSDTLTNRESVVISDLNEELWQHIQNELGAGSLVVAMGAGSIDAWLRQHVAALPAKNKS